MSLIRNGGSSYRDYQNYVWLLEEMPSDALPTKRQTTRSFGTPGVEIDSSLLQSRGGIFWVCQGTKVP